MSPLLTIGLITCVCIENATSIPYPSNVLNTESEKESLVPAEFRWLGDWYYGNEYESGYGSGYGGGDRSGYGGNYGSGYGGGYGSGYGGGYGSGYRGGYESGYEGSYDAGYGDNYGSNWIR